MDLLKNNQTEIMPETKTLSLAYYIDSSSWPPKECQTSHGVDLTSNQKRADLQEISSQQVISYNKTRHIPHIKTGQGNAVEEKGS